MDTIPDHKLGDGFPIHALTLISFTVLLLEHCATFASEVEYIWNKKKTPFSNIFLLNRYFALSAIVVYIFFYLLSQECRDTTSYSTIPGPTHIPQLTTGISNGASSLIFAFTLVTALMADAMVTLRAYAVYHNNKLVLLGLLALSTMHCFLLIWGYVSPHDEHSSTLALSSYVPGGSVPDLSFTLTKGILFAVPTILFNIAVGLLLLGTYRQSRPCWEHMPLLRLIVSDGLVYSAAVVISNIIWVTVHIYSCFVKPVPLLDFTSMEIWSGCITTTMVGRLTLNIRMYDPATDLNEPALKTTNLAGGDQVIDDEAQNRGSIRTFYSRTV